MDNDLEKSFYHDKIQNMMIIGIAGVNGKTTVIQILSHIFHLQNISFFVLSQKEGLSHKNGKSHDKGADTLISFYERVIHEDIKILMIEINQDMYDFIDENNIYLDMCIYTNIVLENHTYLSKILDHIHAHSWVMINADEQDSNVVLKNMTKGFLITYGLGARSTVTASSIKYMPSISCSYCIQRGIPSKNNLDIDPMELEIKINLLGKHNVYNTLAAITGTLIYGIDPLKISNSLESFKGIKRCMNKIISKPYTIINDGCSNTSALDALFETISAMDYEKMYMVYPFSDYEEDKKNISSLCNWLEEENVGCIMSTYSKDQLHRKTFKKTYQKEFEERMKSDHIPYDHEDNLKDAIEKILKLVCDEDLILLVGKDEMNQGEKIVQEILKEKI